MKALNTDPGKWRYRAMIGVGGIGYGLFFSLNHNHTLGREESRSGHFLDQEDFCKLHIVSYYVKKLLGEAFEVFPVGKVGDDDVGKRLIDKIRNVGMHTAFIKVSDTAPTLYSFCFSYPDGSGGNLTTDNSACNELVDADLLEAEPEFERYSQRGIALAVPEVPLAFRQKMLQLATEHQFYRVASFSSDEIQQAITMGLLDHVDLLSLNLDEARRAVANDKNYSTIEDEIRFLLEQISKINSKMALAITNGKNGSWFLDDGKLIQQKSFATLLKSTAGAGDAYLGGLIVGSTLGLSWRLMHELASLIAAFSVTSPNTIAENIDRQSLFTFVREMNLELSGEVMDLLA